MQEAAAPAGLPAGGHRVLVFAFGFASSGIPADWAAGETRPGIRLVQDAKNMVACITDQARAVARRGDILVASTHWGGNWGYAVPPAQRAFAHDLIDRAG